LIIHQENFSAKFYKIMRVVIIDDSSRARVALKSDLEDYCPQVDVVGEAEGVVSGLNLINLKQPDVVFLDIKMGDGTGFDLLEKLDSTNKIRVVFTTAYDEFALKAFRYSAVDYLLKPIDSDDLVKTIEQLNLSVNKLVKSSYLNELLNSNEVSLPKKITLPEADRIHIITIDTIVRCESSKNYTTFYILGGKRITVSKTIKNYEEILAPHNFIRVHHSHLINLEQIQELVKLNGPYLLMNDDSNVPISTRKKELVFEKLKSFY